MITCAIDTGGSLEWLATGEIVKNLINLASHTIPVKYLKVGILNSAGRWFVDLTFLPNRFQGVALMHGDSASWIAGLGSIDVTNGRWVLSIDGKSDIYDVALLSEKKLKIVKNGSDFVCNVEQILVAGKVTLTIIYR